MTRATLAGEGDGDSIGADDGDGIGLGGAEVFGRGGGAGFALTTYLSDAAPPQVAPLGGIDVDHV